MRFASDAPLKQIAINAGLEGGVVAEKVRNLTAGHGLNAATGEYVDMIASGIIDPAKVTRSALQNAASIAALFLTTEAVVADKPEKAAAHGRRPDRWHGRHGLLRTPFLAQQHHERPRSPADRGRSSHLTSSRDVVPVCDSDDRCDERQVRDDHRQLGRVADLRPCVRLEVWTRADGSASRRSRRP